MSGVGGGGDDTGDDAGKWTWSAGTFDEIDDDPLTRHTHDHHPTIVTNWQGYLAWKPEQHKSAERDEYLDALAERLERKCGMLESRKSLRRRFRHLSRAASSTAKCMISREPNQPDTCTSSPQSDTTFEFEFAEHGGGESQSQSSPGWPSQASTSPRVSTPSRVRSTRKRKITQLTPKRVGKLRIHSSPTIMLDQNATSLFPPSSRDTEADDWVIL